MTSAAATQKCNVYSTLWNSRPLYIYEEEDVRPARASSLSLFPIFSWGKQHRRMTGRAQTPLVDCASLPLAGSQRLMLLRHLLGVESNPLLNQRWRLEGSTVSTLGTEVRFSLCNCAFAAFFCFLVLHPSFLGGVCADLFRCLCCVGIIIPLTCTSPIFFRFEPAFVITEVLAVI